MQEYRFGNPTTVVQATRITDEETGKETFICYCRPLGHKRIGTFRKRYEITDAVSQSQAARKAMEIYKKDLSNGEK